MAAHDQINADADQTLREQAEALLKEREGQVGPSGPIPEKLDDLVHELKVYQTELRLQNQQLQRSETALQQSLLRYEALFHALPLGAMVVDERGLVHRANEAGAKLFGFRSCAHFEGHSLLRLIASKDRSRLTVELARSKKTERTVLPRIWVPGDGNPIEIDLHLNPLPPTYHFDRHVLITAVDQTDAYARERQMELLATVIDDMGAGVSAFDRQGRCIYVNRDIQYAAGLSEGEMLGARRTAWMPAPEALKEEQGDAIVLLTKKRQRETVSRLTSDGKEKHLEQIKFPLFDEDNECTGVGELVTDLTAQRLRDRHTDMVMRAYELSRDAIVMTDADNRIVTINAAFERMTGYSEAEVRGENPSVLASGRHSKAFYQAMWRDVMNGGWEGEIWNRRKSGEIYPEWLSISPVRDGDGGVVNYIGVFNDITARKAAEEEIQHLALYDSLTGLANRQLLIDRVGQVIHVSVREKRTFALSFFDLDYFKEINDAHGHDVGDRLLQQVAQRVRRLIRERDTLSRIGGDEFVILFDGGVEDLSGRIQTLLNEINQPYDVGSVRIQVCASIGTAVFPEDGADYDTLLRHADTAMYKAKEDGRNRGRFYSDSLGLRSQRRLQIDAALRTSLDDNELSLVFQPQVDMASEVLMGCEALLRWQSSTLGSVSPAEFIPSAERTGQIEAIGSWVLHNAFAASTRFQQTHPELTLAVNISARQLYDERFLDNVRNAVDATEVDPTRIECELT